MPEKYFFSPFDYVSFPYSVTLLQNTNSDSFTHVFTFLAIEKQVGPDGGAFQPEHDEAELQAYHPATAQSQRSCKSNVRSPCLACRLILTFVPPWKPWFKKQDVQ